MPKERKPQVLHSGSYWQDLRRQKQEREARRRGMLEHGPTPVPGDIGRVVTLPGPPAASRATPLPVVTTNSFTKAVLTSRARDDERLLALFSARKPSANAHAPKVRK
ncbi:hypothetical protein B0H11DRAFT_2215498 [Mycena galericulata]|nr:hypothetical protein B0H11DRAFT_2235721 [Mycena galericulata]KAJ7510754.1 hypothetical protein B0H11DRAFT_2215498 [Mycena galericulata]